MSRAEGTFDIDRFDTQDPHDDRDGVKLARAHISKTFYGDLVGTSETDIITVSHREPGRVRGHRAGERDAARPQGRLRAAARSGRHRDGVPWMTWKIVETTGTGDLAGIHGEGPDTIIGPNGEHSYTLDYEL